MRSGYTLGVLALGIIRKGTRLCESLDHLTCLRIMSTKDTWVKGEFFFLSSIMLCAWSFLEFVVGGVIYELVIYIFFDIDKILYPMVLI